MGAATSARAVPEQLTYELIRPVVLFGDTPAERAGATRKPQSTINRKADRFDELGMASLFEQDQSRKQFRLPPQMRQLIVDLSAEYSALHPTEIARICYAQFERRPSPHTVKRVLASGLTPSHTERWTTSTPTLPLPSMRLSSHRRPNGWPTSSKINWRFTTDDARIKLKHLYPSLQE